MSTAIGRLLGFTIGFSFLFVITRNVFYLVFLWQLKEYRLDRIIAHLKTPIGKKLIFGRLNIIKWILFLGVLSGINFLIRISYFLFWFIWIFEAVFFIRELILYRWRLPQLTLKVILILTAIFLILINFLNGRTVVFGPLVDRFIWFLISIFVLLFNIPAFLYRQFLIYRTKNKILSFPNLTVIGITGSYGKTSIKEFLATILSEKYKVAKTTEFTNTDIGIAKYILNELKPYHEILVVEMGAYKKGEIKAICDMVKPKMGIITGINEQHLELFGSIENTMKAKFELVESLPEKGIAIFNGNNKYCLKMADWSKERGSKTLLYNPTRDVKNIRTFTDHIELTLAENNDLLKVNLLGRQAVENILAAVYAAKSLGLTGKEIKEGVSRIVSASKTMQIAGILEGMNLVDDTFNANPDGVIAAVDYMKLYKGKKILVLTPLIELGQEAEKIHARIGEQASQICDLILLTNLNYHKSIVEGAKKMKNEEKIQIVNTSAGTKLIRENLNKEGVVLFEGKEAGRILERLVKLD